MSDRAYRLQLNFTGGDAVTFDCESQLEAAWFLETLPQATAEVSRFVFCRFAREPEYRSAHEVKGKITHRRDW